MIDLDDTRTLKAHANLRAMYNLVTDTLIKIEDGPYPLPHNYREHVVGDLNYRSGRLAALISLPAEIRRSIDLERLEDEARGAWQAYTAAETLRTAYLYDTDWTNSNAAHYYR